jgi:DNA-binding PadR family transcriptional regulator
LDERALLLLGILRVQSQHGYQINEFIERNLCNVTDMKKATAYATLDRLSQAGYVEVQVEQVGNRPPRRVYAITPTGDRHFHELLRANLAGADRLILPGTIGLMFLDLLPREEAVGYLQQRLADLAAQIAIYEHTPPHKHQIGVDLAVSRQLALLRADRDWLIATIASLESATA